MDHAYLKIDTIEGESTVEGYEKQIEIYSFSYGCSQPTSPVRSNDGPTTGRAMHNMMHFSKRTDLATADLCKNVWSGAVLKDAVLTVCRMDNNKSIAYLVITLENVVIADYNISGGGGIPSESFSLNYAIINIQYIQQQKEGGESGNKAAKHDLKTNKVE